MLKGTVNFNAPIKGKGNGVTFPFFEFKPREPGVGKVEIGAPNGNAIRTGVHFTTVASRAEAQDLATKVNTAALDRIAFRHDLVIERARIVIAGRGSRTSWLTWGSVLPGPRSTGSTTMETTNRATVAGRPRKGEPETGAHAGDVIRAVTLPVLDPNYPAPSSSMGLRALQGDRSNGLITNDATR